MEGTVMGGTLGHILEDLQVPLNNLKSALMMAKANKMPELMHEIAKTYGDLIISAYTVSRETFPNEDEKILKALRDENSNLEQLGKLQDKLNKPKGRVIHRDTRGRSKSDDVVESISGEESKK